MSTIPATETQPGVEAAAKADDARMALLVKLLAVVCVLGFILPFGYLLIGLHFPDQSAQTSFALFQQNGAAILVSYYALGLDGLLVIVYTLLVAQRSAQGGRMDAALLMSVIAGALGGLMQTIGYLRWPFILPTLASAYNDAHASAATRAADVLVFQAVDQFAGVLLSEHLFYLLIGAWGIALGWRLLRAQQAPRWVAWLGVASGALFWLSSVEQFDIASLATILLAVVVVSRLVWAVWTISLAWGFTSPRANQ